MVARVAIRHGDKMPEIKVVRLAHAEGLPLPAYETEGAAGMDLVAAVTAPLAIHPQQRVTIPTGLQIAVPPGHELQIRSRSGLAAKDGLMVLNSPGTVDEDFRGEIRVILANLGEKGFVIVRGMRIAQAVLAPVIRATWLEVGELPPTNRDPSGFGSTGTSVKIAVCPM